MMANSLEQAGTADERARRMVQHIRALSIVTGFSLDLLGYTGRAEVPTPAGTAEFWAPPRGYVVYAPQ